ncbi:MAG: TrbI/VirB10 family protein [Acidobacteriota bacterium]|nr:TrbI/VirB10 family protein [Acidobacteriota bacterium]
MDGKNIKDKLTGLKISDPIAVAFIVVGLAVVYFFLFPTGKKKDTTELFEEKVEIKQEEDERKAGVAQQRFSEHLSRRAETFEENKAIREERQRAEFAEKRYRELQHQMETQQERFPRRRFLEEIEIQSFFAPIADIPDGSMEETKGEAGVQHPVTADPVPRQADSEPEGQRLEIRAGTWIPVILHNRMRAGLDGYGTGTVREDVFDITGAHVAIPKGSRVTLKFIEKEDYFLSAMVAEEIITADGRHIQIPFPVHDPQGATGLDPRKSGTFNRHLWAKIGMTSLVAAIATAPNLLAGDVTDLAQLSYVERTTKGLEDLLKSSLNIPNEKTFNAGARIHFLVVNSFTVPPGREPDDSREAYRAGMEALKARIFDYQRLIEAQPDNLNKALRDHHRNRPAPGLIRGGN